MNEEIQGRVEVNMNLNKLRNEQQAAELLSITVSAMRKWRTLGKGPAYVKIGRLVRYAEPDLAAYVEANRKAGGTR